MDGSARWADLPYDILAIIIRRKLHFVDDFIRLVAVCKAWHLFVPSMEKPSLPPGFPWLMLAEEKNHQDDDENHNSEEYQQRGFFSLVGRRVHKFELPEACNKVCVGASYGWLLTIDIDLNVNLLHPFTRRQIQLPPQPASVCEYKPEMLREVFFKKVIMTTNPWKSSGEDYDHDCIVFVIYGHRSLLGFTRLDHKAWFTIPTEYGNFQDIVYYKGQFYGVNHHRQFFLCNINGTNSENVEATMLVSPPEGTRDSIQKYLVESSGDLLLISRHRAGFYYHSDELLEEEEEEEEVEGERRGYVTHHEPYITVGFTVLRLRQKTDLELESGTRYSWEKVDSLGERALFLGANSSVSVSPSDYNRRFRSNCIYFTDDCEFASGARGGAGHDMGVFCMEDATIKPHYTGHSLSEYCTPIWYI